MSRSIVSSVPSRLAPAQLEDVFGLVEPHAQPPHVDRLLALSPIARCVPRLVLP